MTNADAQLAVWALLIKLLKEKGYRVWINHNKDSCRLKITWISEMDEQEFIDRKKILKGSYATF